MISIEIALEIADKLFWKIAENHDLKEEDKKKFITLTEKICSILCQFIKTENTKEYEEEIDKLVKYADQQIGLKSC